MTISSADENRFVVNNILQNFSSNGGPNLSNVPVWTGIWDPIGAVSDDGSGPQHTANFVWVDGSTSTYRNWFGGEPNDYPNIEYYGTINWHYGKGDANSLGTWNDVPLNGTTNYGGNTNVPYYGIAEINVPEPACGALLCAGVALMGWRRRSPRHD